MSAIIDRFTGPTSGGPLFHVVPLVIIALFIPPLAHGLSRPGDFKSPSFISTTATYVIGLFFGGLFINGFNPMPFDGGFGFFGLVTFLAVIWTVVVVIVSNDHGKRSEYTAVAASSGPTDI